jgi:hypothetical protein
MSLKYLWAGVSVCTLVLGAGCCCTHSRSCCPAPAVVNSVPLPAAPAPCCGAPGAPAAIGPTAPVFSSPAPLYR